MRTIHRLIDLTTLKKNPTAGRTEYQVAGRIYETQNPDGTVTKKREVHTVHSLMPEPTWLYKYESMTVQCEECDARFEADELEDEYLDMDQPVNRDVCPPLRTGGVPGGRPLDLRDGGRSPEAEGGPMSGLLRVKALSISIFTAAEKDGYSPGEICAAGLMIFVTISYKAKMDLARLVQEVTETYKELTQGEAKMLEYLRTSDRYAHNGDCAARNPGGICNCGYRP